MKANFLLLQLAIYNSLIKWVGVVILLIGS